MVEFLGDTVGEMKGRGWAAVVTIAAKATYTIYRNVFIVMYFWLFTLPYVTTVDILLCTRSYGLVNYSYDFSNH